MTRKIRRRNGETRLEKNAQGIYERNGQKFSFTIQVRDYEEERIDIANITARQLQNAGVDMRIALVTRFDWKADYNGFWQALPYNLTLTAYIRIS